MGIDSDDEDLDHDIRQIKINRMIDEDNFFFTRDKHNNTITSSSASKSRKDSEIFLPLMATECKRNNSEKITIKALERTYHKFF